jgi:hypothetical protein
MAILFMDGLDVYENVDAPTAIGWSYRVGATVATFSTALGRFGGAALEARASANSAIWQYPYAFSTNTDYFTSFSFRANSIPGSGVQRFFGLTDTAGAQCFLLSLTSTGAIRYANAPGTTTSDSAAGVITASTWYRVEVKFNLGTNTSTGTLEVRVNGVSVLAVTAQNIFASLGGALLRYFNDQSATADHRYFDDIVINDTTGTTNNTWMDDVRIDTIQPNGDTAQADWAKSTGTSGFALIDDTLGASDGDGTYLSSNTVGNKSEFDMTSLPSASGSIYALQMRVCAERSGLTARTFRSYLKNSAAVVNGPTLQAFALTYAWNLGGIASTDPNTSAPWTDSGVGSVKLGLELVS